MDMPLAGGLAARSAGPFAAPSGILTVNWRRGLNFNGHVARFDGSVVAATARAAAEHRNHGGTIAAADQLLASQHVGRSRKSKKFAAAAECQWKTDSLDAQQQPASYDRMELADLAVNVLSGALTGGPGWLNSVRTGMENTAGRPQIAAMGAGAACKINSAALHITFQRSIDGNLLRRQLTFHDDVRMTYAPTNDWQAMIESDNPEQLGPGGVVAHCDQLSVTEMLLPVGDCRAIELEALGNTTVEGTTMTAAESRSLIKPADSESLTPMRKTCW